MSKKTTETKTEKQAENKRAREHSDAALDSVRGTATVAAAPRDGNKLSLDGTKLQGRILLDPELYR